MKTLAKIQAGNTWELSAVPYIPAVANTARHVANLREAGVDGLMLGWTLGGYPSPNLEVVAALGQAEGTPERAMEAVALHRFGRVLAPAVVRAWTTISEAFGEFPYHVGTVYDAPLQLGPANPLWEAPTGYRATMIGFPYDDLDRWRQVYPADAFAAQLDRVADGFAEGYVQLTEALPSEKLNPRRREHREFMAEQGVAEAASIHFRSVANQARFVQARSSLDGAHSTVEAAAACKSLGKILRDEIALARALYGIQTRTPASASRPRTIITTCPWTWSRRS